MLDSLPLLFRLIPSRINVAKTVGGSSVPVLLVCDPVSDTVDPIGFIKPDISILV